MMKIISKQGTVIVTAPEQKKDRLPEEVEVVQMDVAMVVMESMQDKMQIIQLQEDLGMALLEIMQLKMGGM